MIPSVDAEQIYTSSEILANIDGWEEMFLDGAFEDFLYNGEYWSIRHSSRVLLFVL